jgi:signal transduction histidine kinase
VLEVRDQGQGMEPELLARALDPFFSGFASPGIGLGLEIARLAAKAHDGEIELISTPSQGTTARIVLPADVAGGTHAA